MRPVNDRTDASIGTPLEAGASVSRGDRTCLLAAVENGADAVYFGDHLRRPTRRSREDPVSSEPQDLAAYDLIPRLIELDVSSLKIEGRLKSPEYVANITRHYRRAIDAAWAGQPVAFTPRDVEEMQLSFSRGFSHGFLDGNNHKVLVRGDYAKKRGIFVGRVESVSIAGVVISCSTIVKPGDGVVFDGDDVAGVPEQGGRIYEVLVARSGRVELRLGRARSTWDGSSLVKESGRPTIQSSVRDCVDRSKVPRPGSSIWTWRSMPRPDCRSRSLPSRRTGIAPACGPNLRSLLPDPNPPI